MHSVLKNLDQLCDQFKLNRKKLLDLENTIINCVPAALDEISKSIGEFNEAELATDIQNRILACRHIEIKPLFEFLDACLRVKTSIVSFNPDRLDPNDKSTNPRLLGILDQDGGKEILQGFKSKAISKINDLIFKLISLFKRAIPTKYNHKPETYTGHLNQIFANNEISRANMAKLERLFTTT